MYLFKEMYSTDIKMINSFLTHEIIKSYLKSNVIEFVMSCNVEIHCYWKYFKVWFLILF